MIRSTLAIVAASAVLMLPAIPAHAVTVFSGNYTVSANSDDTAGLAVVTLNDLGSGANPTSSFSSLTIPLGNTIFRDLFTIFADEPSPFSGNDFVSQMISVAFNITGTLPGSATITGTTVATDDITAELHWAGPATIIFSDHTFLTITLFDALFDDSSSSTVLARFQTGVPEPGTLALLGAGLIGVFVRRKRVVA